MKVASGPKLALEKVAIFVHFLLNCVGLELIHLSVCGHEESCSKIIVVLLCPVVFVP